MKTLRTILLSAISGAFTATLVTLFVGKQMEQRLNHRQAKTSQPEAQADSPTPPRISRTMEEMSPTFKQFSTKFDWENPTIQTPSENAELLKATIKETSLENLTELEAVTIKKTLTDLVNRMWLHAEELLHPNRLPPSFESFEGEE